ncbi:M48 family metallopeptidase [bacterium]|nr:M48 family metallopeptidase [bacterium]
MNLVGRLFVAGQKEAVLCSWCLQGSHLILSAVEPGAGTWTLEVAQSDLTLGGFNEAQVVLKQGDLIFYGTRAEMENPLRLLGLERIHRALGKESTRVRSSVRRSYVWLSIFVAFLGLLGLAGWWVTERVVHVATGMTPVSWDVELGKAAWKTQQMGESEIKDPAIVKPVQEIVSLLSKPYQSQGYQFEVHVLDSPQVNAFAMPGGQMAVFTGLLKEAEGPDEVAGVLAHEIQHVVQRHGIRNIYSQLRWQMALAVLVGDGSSLHAQLLGSGAFLAGLSYGREMESEADREGLALLEKAGMPKGGMVKFFKKLDKQQGAVETYLKYLSTHPSSKDRISALEQQMTKAPGGGSVPVDWASLQTALGKGSKDAGRGRK